MKWDDTSPAAVAERERDDRVRNALDLYLNQTTVRPGPTDTPTWMRNPYFALFALWKPFMVSFHGRILQPAWGKLIEEGNPAPITFMALSFIPVMLFADMLRDVAKTALDDDEDDFRPSWKDDWTLSDHVLYAIERSGFYGQHEMITDVIRPLTEGEPGRAATEALGPVAGNIRRVTAYGLDQMPYPTSDITRNWG
jgi:hypothetical protein